jgi:protein-disulfide isomerase
MTECDFCGEEFESERNLHIHWGEEHEEELNSHQQEQVKKAEREKNNEEQDKKRKRKKYITYSIVAVIGMIFVEGIANQVIQSSSNEPGFDLENQPMLGDSNASVSVVEFGDYQCHYCNQFEQNVLPELKENYIDTGKVKFYYMNYPFLGEGSRKAAVASECIYQQNKTQFWDFHKSLFQIQDREKSEALTTERIIGIAKDSTQELDYDELRTCIDNQQTNDDVTSDFRIGNERGVSGTPKVFVNGKKLQNWRYQDIKTAIDNELQ